MSDVAWWVYGMWGVVGVLVGWWIGAVKGYPLLGALLGIFAVIGWIIMALIPSRSSRPLPASTSISHSDAHRPPDLAPGRLPPHPPDVAVMREPHDKT